MDFNDVDKYFDSFYDKLSKFADEILCEMNKASVVTVEKTYTDFGVYQQERIQQIFDRAVGAFYASYIPNLYDRTESLYNVLNMSYDRYGRVSYEKLDDLLDPARMRTDRKGGDLFNKVFVEGWHGGAENIGTDSEVWGDHPSPGTPYYRKPGFITTKDGTTKWHRWGKWGQKAVRTIAPATMMYNSLLAAERGDLHSKLLEIVKGHNDSAMEKIHHNVIPMLRAKYFN